MKLLSVKENLLVILKKMVDSEGNIIEAPHDIANCLNSHFGSVGHKMAKKFEEMDPNHLKDPLSFIKKEQNQNSMIVFPTNTSEIINVISKLDNKKSCGYDLVSNKILKATQSTILPYLVSLFNQCILEGVFPSAYKIAQVIPLFKGGDKENPNCYRPISLLPTIGKLFEKLLSYRIIKFLDKHNILSKHQFGFSAKFATEYAITDIYEKLISNLDSGVAV